MSITTLYSAPSQYRALMYVKKSQAHKTGESGINKERNYRNHRFIFLLVGMSLCANLNVSQLTQVVFDCDNFATHCRLAFLSASTITLGVIIVKWTPPFMWTVIMYVMLFLSHTIHGLVGYFGSGIAGRVFYTLMYASVGAFEPLLMQGCSDVISKFFLNNARGYISAGWTVGDLLLAVTQGLAISRIGSETISQVRRCLMFVHSVQTLVAFVGSMWMIYLYFSWNHLLKKIEKCEKEKQAVNGKTKKRDEKLLEVLRMYCRYWPRMFLMAAATAVRHLFYPGLIPFHLPLQKESMLAISMAENVSISVGALYAADVDETIDTTQKLKTHEHAYYLLWRDKWIFAGLATLWIYNLFTVHTVWTRKFDYISSAKLMFFLTVIQSFWVGYLTTRGINGCLPMLKYYNAQEQGNTKIVTDEQLKLDNVLGDVVYAADIAACTFVALIAVIVDRCLHSHKRSISYILKHSTGHLTREDVATLLKGIQG